MSVWDGAALIRDTYAEFARLDFPDFSGIPVANIGDAMERTGMCDCGIQPVWRGAQCSGPAFPVMVRRGDNAGIHASIKHLRQGDVLVVNGAGDTTRALFGGLLTRRMMQIGVAGVIIDGCVRDRSDIEALQFPVWARGVTPAGPYKHGPAILGEPTAIGGTVVSAGDMVVADDDGVVVIPFNRATEIYESALEVMRYEHGQMGSFDSSVSGSDL